MDRMSEMVLLAREQVLRYDQDIKRAGRKYKRIMVLQPDVVLDKDGNAMFVECNTNGYMIGDIHKDFFSLQKETKALLQMVGADGYPKRTRYDEALREHIGEFCRTEEEGCSEAVKLEIAEMAHETHHASLGWYKIFPGAEDRKHMAYFKRHPKWAELFTRMDRSMIRWFHWKKTVMPTLDKGRTGQVAPSAGLSQWAARLAARFLSNKARAASK